MKENKSRLNRRPIWEIIRLPFLFAAFIALSEWSDPLPAHITLPVRIGAALLVWAILREFHRARREVDEKYATRYAGLADWWKRRKEFVTQEAWTKLQRIATWTIVAFAYGVVFNIVSDKCDSALQCVIRTPRIVLENTSQIVQFAIFMAITLFQIAFMMLALVKLGSYKVVQPGTIPETFDNVWGQDKARDKVVEQVRLLEESGEVEARGGYMPKGVILHGPPGCGKTLMAKAAANYSSKPLILIPPGGFASTFLGVNFLKVWSLFRTIRKFAQRYGGAIVFFDEIDSLGSRGGEVERVAMPGSDACVADPDLAYDIVVTGSQQMGTLEAFLAAMDGMDEPRGLLNRLLVFLGFKPLPPPDYKALFLGATNRLQALDPALMREGRFGRLIHVTYPTVEGRLKTYEGYLRKIEHSLSQADVEWAAHNHARGTGAEIKGIVNEALLLTYRDGRPDPGTVKFNDLMQAQMFVKFGESDGPFEREGGRYGVAVHEAGHAVAFHYLCRDRQRIWFASIEQVGQSGGRVAPTALREDWLLSRSEMLSDIEVALASRVAETLVFGEASNGHGGDGRMATELAANMVRTGHAPGQIGTYDEDHVAFRMRQEMILQEALEKTKRLLADKVPQIRAVAALLLEQLTVPGSRIHNLLDRMDREGRAHDGIS